MKTKIEIIEETANYYNSTKRSVNVFGDCVYIGFSGKRCAFSRCCNEDSNAYLESVDKDGDKYTYKGVGALKDFDSLLDDEYRGHSKEFWESIQMFHDYSSNWDKNGLTEYGKQELERLKRAWQ
jgi:hypothetical protein